MPKHLARPPCSNHMSIKIYLSLSLSISLSLPLYLSDHCLYTRHRNITKSRTKEQEKKSCVCAHGRSPLQCPWVLSISGKQARPSADCRGCCVRYSRPRPRPGRPACPPSIVIFYKPTPYTRTKRRCYRRHC